jgi:predicted membrane-bound mannosyltransferase
LKAQLAQLELSVQLVLLDLKAPQAPYLAQQALQVQLALQALRDLLVLIAQFQDLLVLQVQLVKLVQLDPRVTQELRDRKVKLVLLAQLVQAQAITHTELLQTIRRHLSVLAI